MAGSGGGGRGKVKKKKVCINRLLTDDLLVEILHRNPCKAAFQCKSVCKRWRKVTSTANFINCFTRRHYSDYQKKIRDDGVVVKCILGHSFVIPSEFKHNFSFDFLPFFNSPQKKPTHFIAGSGHALFLCTADLNIQDQTVYYVCNPVTKRWVALPPPPPLLESDESVQLYLGLAVSGFTSSTTEFKVVRVLPPVTGEKERSNFAVDVFSSNTGNWARLITSASPKPFTWYRTRTPAIYYRGLLHWNGTSQNQIVVYDLSKNSFCFIIDPPDIITDPPDVLIKYSPMVHALSGGSYYVCQLYNETLRMWQLNYLDDKQQPEWIFKGQYMLPRYILHGRRWLKDVVVMNVLTIHRYDPNIVYLRAGARLLPNGKRNKKQDVFTCNLKTRTLNLVYESENDLVQRANAAYTIGLYMWPPPLSPIP